MCYFDQSGYAFLSSEIASLEPRLKALVFNKIDGAKIRSTVQWLENGEKPMHFRQVSGS